MTRDPNLAAVWGADTVEEARETYDRWAQTYEAENLAKGMRQPFIAAALLARHMPADGPILDAACGTGLVGEMLSVLGFSGLVGCDISAKMRTGAARFGVYDTLRDANLAALPFEDDTFAGFACVGAFGPGHAPPRSLHELCRVTKPGGVGVFTLREDTFREQGFVPVMDDLAGTKWTLLEEAGPARTYLIGEPQLFTRYFAVKIL
ncbi:MAG: class I SAM-dependent methyltransferase [Pseudomonadota bacterium]